MVSQFRKTSDAVTVFGKKFSSVWAASFHQNIACTPSTFCTRVRTGWSLEDAATIPTLKKGVSREFQIAEFKRSQQEPQKEKILEASPPRERLNELADFLGVSPETLVNAAIENYLGKLQNKLGMSK